MQPRSQVLSLTRQVIKNPENEIGPQDPRTATLLGGARKVHDLGGPRHEPCLLFAVTG